MAQHPALRTRRPADAVAEVTNRGERDQTVVTFHLGFWEQGALQVLMDALRGGFDSCLPEAQAFLAALAHEGTTLGGDNDAVEDSLASLGALVRGFSQADRVTITATVDGQ